ncbi:MAG: hypothetical protein K6B42_07180 [Clostridia bacterium]|nr:hypothetical protein [Clostridia bacterium]
MVTTVFASAEGGLVTGGASSITSGDNVSFTVNLENKEEYGTEFTVSISVSPSPESVTIENVNASGNAVSGSITVKSADLDGVTSFSGRVYPGDVTEETTYTVSVSIAGDVSGASDSFSFTVEPEEEETESADTEKTKASDEMANKGKKQSSAAIGSAAGSTAGASASSSSSSVTYNGSADNYLQDLSVSGYEFTQKFNKTRDTYFVNVKNSVTALDVCATACDSSATVRITGEDDVAEDMSKIMISVTADNGDVRTYRIYVTHGLEE